MSYIFLQPSSDIHGPLRTSLSLLSSQSYWASYLRNADKIWFPFSPSVNIDIYPLTASHPTWRALPNSVKKLLRGIFSWNITGKVWKHFWFLNFYLFCFFIVTLTLMPLGEVRVVCSCCLLCTTLCAGFVLWEVNGGWPLVIFFFSVKFWNFFAVFFSPYIPCRKALQEYLTTYELLLLNKIRPEGGNSRQIKLNTIKKSLFKLKVRSNIKLETNRNYSIYDGDCPFPDLHL